MVRNQSMHAGHEQSGYSKKIDRLGSEREEKNYETGLGR